MLLLQQQEQEPSQATAARYSIGSENSTVFSSKRTTATIEASEMLVTATPPVVTKEELQQALVLDPSNSDSTVHEGSRLSTMTTTTSISEGESRVEGAGGGVDQEEEKEYEIVALQEIETETTAVDKEEEQEEEETTFPIMTTLSSRAIHKTPSIASSISALSSMHQMEKSISSSSSNLDFIQLEKSTSTSRRTLMGRKKSTKKLLQKVEHSLSPTAEETNSLKSTFASYLQGNKKSAIPSAAADLNRSKSKRKWSMNTNGSNKIPQLSSPSFLDPITFLSEPTSDPIVVTTLSDSDYQRLLKKHSETCASLSLFNKLHESMIRGGCVTSNLHIPMDLW